MAGSVWEIYRALYLSDLEIVSIHPDGAFRKGLHVLAAALIACSMIIRPLSVIEHGISPAIIAFTWISVVFGTVTYEMKEGSISEENTTPRLYGLQISPQVLTGVFVCVGGGRVGGLSCQQSSRMRRVIEIERGEERRGGGRRGRCICIYTVRAPSSSVNRSL